MSIIGNMPKYQIHESINEGILEIVIKGEATLGTIKNIQDEVIAAIKKANVTSLLVDARDIKGRGGPTEPYFRVRNYPPDRPRVDVAVVDLEENVKFQSLHEIAALKAGLSMKSFTDIDAARVWLKEKWAKKI
jgi:hypothetical protein